MALVTQPDIIICDEPTTALDVTIQKEILDLLKSLIDQENLSMIFVSHDLDVVASLCDDVIVMYKGEIVERGVLPETFISPKHIYTKALLSCKPQLAKQKTFLHTVGDILEGKNEVRLRSIRIVNSQATLLEVKGLSVRFAKKKKRLFEKTTFNLAVDDVSFKVKAGTTMGIVGESGSGKSTIANCIAGLLQPYSGEIIYKEKKIDTLVLRQDQQARREIQLIFQDPYSSLNPSMKVGEAVAEPIIYHRLNDQVKDRVDELFDQVGLERKYMTRYPHQLSGGQRQRVCIARALAVAPKLLICDESVSALDVSVQAQILNLLDELQSQLNLTMIFISHDLSVVNYICDDVIVMKDGKIVEAGVCEAVISNPQHGYTKNLIQSIPASIRKD